MRIKFTLPENYPLTDSVMVKIQPYVNDVATEETMLLKARRVRPE